MLEKLRSKTIRTGGALVLLGVLSFLIINHGSVFNLYDQIKIIGAMGVYLLMALVSLDFRGIEEMFNEIWNTTKKDIPQEEKLDLIKSFLESSCSRWNKYWEMYQEMVNGGCERPSETWRRVVDRLQVIYRGEINVQQIFWIYVYAAYVITFSCTDVMIPVPLDIILILGISILILLSSGHILGMGKFLQEIFRIVSCKNEASVESRLKTLETYIKRGAKRFYYLSVNGNKEFIITKKKRYPKLDDYTKQVIGYWILSVMGFFTPFLIGLLALTGFDPLLTTFITGVWGSTATMLGLLVRHYFKVPKGDEPSTLPEPTTPP